LYLGGVIIKVIWQYLFPGITVNIWIYFWGILFVTLLTTIYTAVGGIKAVVWTDFIQASLMIGSMIFTTWLLVHHTPGGLATVKERLGGFPAFFQTGLDFGQGLGFGIKKLLEEPYTLFSAFIASTFLTMATHGTDQDNVQRMLTAKDFQRSRLSLILSGLADLPVAFGFLLVGILLSVYYEVRPDLHLPAADNEIFAYYIVTQMPVGIRGLIIAGVFATMMGSTSAALNALATSFTKDFYLPYFRRAVSQKSSIYAARVATVVFGGLMVAVATLAAYAVLRDSKLTIIPLALQSFGYAYGSLLAVFLLGMLTKRRGRDETNVLAMMLGVAAVLVFCKVRLPAISLRELAFTGRLRAEDWAFGSWLPNWWPAISFPWWVLVGCLACFAVSFIFATPSDRVKMAERHVAGRDDQVKSPVSR